MAINPTALILDDDEDSAAFLKFQLQSAIPSIHVETRLEPDVAGNFDIYLIDNDFCGEQFAGRLAKRIRRLDRSALVVAFSAFLDAQTLKQLINSNCDGAFEKQNQDEVRLLIDIVTSFIKDRAAVESRNNISRGLIGTIHSITDLLREWNRRLDDQSRLAKNSDQANSKNAA